MKRVIIRQSGNYIHHGIGYTNHDGYSGTSDHINRVSIKGLIAWYHENQFQPGEKYQLEVNNNNVWGYRQQRIFGAQPKTRGSKGN